MTNCFLVGLSEKVASSVSLLLIALLWFHYESAKGVLVQTPSNTTVIANHSTFFNCSKFNNKSDELTWHHFTVDGKAKGVYEAGSIRGTYKGRFDIDKNLNFGTFNLLVQRPEPSDAGRYECVEDPLEKDTGASAELVVLDSSLVCRSDKDLNEIVGPTECAKPIEPDQLHLSCSVTYSGNIPPRMQWRKVGSELQSMGNSDCGVRGNRKMCNATLGANLQMEGSVYICHIITEEQYNCSLKVNKTIYTFPDTSVRAITTSEEAFCSANTSKDLPCSYKWYKDNKTEQSGQTLKPSNPGLYRCEAECKIRNETCAFTAMVINASEPESNKAGVAAPIAIVIAAIILTIAIVVCCQCKKRKQRHHPKVVVSVHSNADANIPKIDQAEETIVKLIYDILEGKTPAIAKHLLDIVLGMIEDGLNGARVEKSIVFFFQCKNLAQLKRLMDLLETKELQKNIELIYKEFLSTCSNVGVEVTWDDAEFKKAETKLQGRGAQSQELQQQPINKHPPEAMELLSFRNEGNKSDEVDADDVIQKAFNAHSYIGRGLSGGVIHGPGQYEGKQCACEKIMCFTDQQTPAKEGEMTKEEKIRRKGQQWMELDHDNLIKFYDVVLKPKAAFIIMEYTAGGSLRNVLKKCTESDVNLEMPVVKDWATQIVKGMEYLHENGIVHKNLHSVQILIVESFEASDILNKTLKISQFRLIADNPMSTDGEVKFSFSAPEAFSGIYEKEGDVWSFGIVMWEMLTKKQPYKGEMRIEKIIEDSRRGAVELEIPHSCPAELKEILIECRSVTSSGRPPFSAILRRLQEWKAVAQKE